MSLFSGDTNIFGLDIGTTGIRVVQVRSQNGLKSLSTYGGVAINSKLTQSDAQADRQQLAATIRKLITDARISTEHAVVGIPTAKVFTTVVDMPPLTKQELGSSIRYQAEQYVPMPLDKAKLDWAVLGPSPDGSGNQEVMLVAAPNSYTESILQVLEGIGLNIAAIEPDAIAMMRSLLAPTYTGACVILDMGAHSTDLIMTYNGAPRLVRSIAIGGETLIKSAAQNLNVDPKQAVQFVAKFGLSELKLEGQVFRALKSTVDNLIDEVKKSQKFFEGRYKQANIEKIIISGGGARLPEFPVYLANSTGLPVEIGNSWTNVGYDPAMQDTLIGISSEFSVAAGLALREEVQ